MMDLPSAKPFDELVHFTLGQDGTIPLVVKNGIS